ncbi:hypothetical protein JCM1840_004025, partial [Sporobolomyces johnsonii]
ACWSSTGHQLYVARRSSSIQIYDLRHSSPLSTLSLPASTGPVSAVAALPNGRHLLSASWDCVRLWDLDVAVKEAEARSSASAKGRGMGRKGVRVVPGHYGGTCSSLYVDPLAKWLITTSGNRGWEGNSTENLIVHEIKPTYP